MNENKTVFARMTRPTLAVAQATTFAVAVVTLSALGQKD